MKLATRILLAIMAVGVFAIGAQAQAGGQGSTGDVVIISG
jgi:hypothetical protein